MSSLGECNICASSFNKSNHKRVNCPYCNYEVCSDCTKTMMIENGENCPNCSKGWNKEFIKENTTKIWFDGPYKDKRKEQLFEREKSLLQTAIPLIKAKQYNENMKKKIEEVKKKIAELEVEKTHYEFELRHNTNRIKAGLEESAPDGTVVNEGFNRVVKFIKPCPVNDCRGYLSTSWKCELCDTWVCKDCLEIKNSKFDEEHKCNNDNIESAKLLLKDSKPCPSCGARIHRIEGCNAMFCVSCKTCFNWKTGAINKANSNPHFHEWAAKKNKENVGRSVNQATNCLPYDTKYSIEKNLIAKNISKKGVGPMYNSTYTFINKVNNFIQKIHHLREVILPGLNIRQENNNKLIDLRVKYLTKEIDENEWKRQIFSYEKKMEYDTTIYNLYDIVANVITNSILSLNTVNTQGEVDTVINEIGEVIEYFNEHSIKTSKYYGYNTYKFILYNPNGKYMNSFKGCSEGDIHLDFLSMSFIKKDKKKKEDNEEKKEM